MDQNLINIAILILPESTMLSVASVIDPLRAANRLSGQKLFNWEIYSPEGGPIPISGEITLETKSEFGATDNADILIIIASFNHQKYTNLEMLTLIRKKAGSFKAILCVEAGTWVLAKTGLLDNRTATTHWEDFEDFGNDFPNINVQSFRYVIDDKYWTCGGASPAFDMMLNLIRETQSTALALNVASVFIYDQSHSATDVQPSVSIGILEAIEPRIAKAINIMEANIDAPITTAAIAKRIGVSVKMLEILFNRHLKQTPGSYYLQLRLQTAIKLIQDTNYSMQQISIRTGFSGQSSFTRAIKNQFGKTPSNLRIERI